jgi:hypothetical protein
MPISNAITPITVVQDITNNYTTEEITNVTEVKGNKVLLFGLESPYSLSLIEAQIGNIYFSSLTEDFYVLAALSPARFVSFAGTYLVPANSTEFTNFLINVNIIQEGLGEFIGSTEEITFDPGEIVLGETLVLYDLKGTWMLWRSLTAQVITFSVEYLPGYESPEGINLSILKGTYYDNFLEEYQHYYINGISPIIEVMAGEIYAIRASISNNYPAKFKVTISEYQP